MSDPVAAFAKQVDKYHAVYQGLIYQETGETVDAQEFINTAEKEITHPVLLKYMEQAREKVKLLKERQ